MDANEVRLRVVSTAEMTAKRWRREGKGSAQSFGERRISTDWYHG